MTTKTIGKQNIRIHWEGDTLEFSELTGLELPDAGTDYRDGLQRKLATARLQGLEKRSRIVLKRGIIESRSPFCRWITTTGQSHVERHDVEISLLDERGAPVLKCRLIRAFPVKVLAGDLMEGGKEVAIEQVELAHEGITILT